VRQLKWFLIAAIAAAAAHSGRGNAGVPDAPLSLGYPNAGKLVGGRRFRETTFMITVPDHASSRVRWALPALLSVLDRASRIVARKYPGSILEVGELSRQTGGPITSHRSHQNGRDADVGFYQVDLDGQAVRAPCYVRFKGDGASPDDPTVRFDEKRNWAFVRAVLEDPHYEVRQIFIYAPLRARLLAYAAKVGAPREVRLKAAQAMMQPANALPHDDHFHIRISCPADQVDLGCTDLPLWHAPGSPDEFAPDLLAEAPRPAPMGAPSVFSPYSWGRLSKLWSIQQGLCQKVDLTCSDSDEGPACENMGDFEPPISPLAPIEMPEAPAVPGLNTPPAGNAAPFDSTGAPHVSPASPEADDLLSNVATPGGEPVAWFAATLDTPSNSDTALCSATPEAPRLSSAVTVSSALALYCAMADEPNACERPITALASKTASTLVDPSVLE
jgi:penicillin-insensitive murein endopeptidase